MFCERIVGVGENEDLLEDHVQSSPMQSTNDHVRQQQQQRQQEESSSTSSSSSCLLTTSCSKSLLLKRQDTLLSNISTTIDSSSSVTNNVITHRNNRNNDDEDVSDKNSNCCGTGCCGTGCCGTGCCGTGCGERRISSSFDSSCCNIRSASHDDDDQEEGEVECNRRRRTIIANDDKEFEATTTKTLRNSYDHHQLLHHHDKNHHQHCQCHCHYDDQQENEEDHCPPRKLPRKKTMYFVKLDSSRLCTVNSPTDVFWETRDAWMIENQIFPSHELYAPQLTYFETRRRNITQFESHSPVFRNNDQDQDDDDDDASSPARSPLTTTAQATTTTTTTSKSYSGTGRMNQQQQQQQKQKQEVCRDRNCLQTVQEHDHHIGADAYASASSSPVSAASSSSSSSASSPALVNTGEQQQKPQPQQELLCGPAVFRKCCHKNVLDVDKTHSSSSDDDFDEGRIVVRYSRHKALEFSRKEKFNYSNLLPIYMKPVARRTKNPEANDNVILSLGYWCYLEDLFSGPQIRCPQGASAQCFLSQTPEELKAIFMDAPRRCFVKCCSIAKNGKRFNLCADRLKNEAEILSSLPPCKYLARALCIASFRGCREVLITESVEGTELYSVIKHSFLVGQQLTKDALKCNAVGGNASYHSSSSSIISSPNGNEGKIARGSVNSIPVTIYPYQRSNEHQQKKLLRGLLFMSERTFLHIAHQMVKVLVFFKAFGVVHGDLKPENILVQNDWSIKVIDFGGSSIWGSQHVPGQATAEYAAPEWLMSKGTVAPHYSADVFSAGMTMRRMLGLVNVEWQEQLLYNRRKPHYANSIKAYYQEPARVSLCDSMRLSSETLQLLESMTRFEPSSRPDPFELLTHPAFTRTAGKFCCPRFSVSEFLSSLKVPI